MHQHPPCAARAALALLFAYGRWRSRDPLTPHTVPRVPRVPRPCPQVLRPLSAYTCPLLTEPDPRVMPAARALAAAALRFEHANRRR